MAIISHTARVDGETLTAAKYNADFDNIISSGLIPTGIEDYSGDVSTMQTVTDPGESGSESLATTLAGEIARLRYAIKEIRGTAQWYITNATKVGMPHIASDNGVIAWPDATSSNVYYLWPIPHDYATGDVTLKIWRRGAASGTAVMTYSTFRLRDSTAVSTIASSQSINFAPGDTNTHVTNIAIAAASFTSGDMLLWRVSRDGANGSDDMALTVAYDGASISYTGYAGR